MNRSDPYRLTSPCSNCPFRTDIRPYLLADRVREIRESLIRSEFSCHKTLDYSEVEDVEDEPGTANAGHCAGALILLEKEGTPSQMMRICERIGLYDPSKLDMKAPVYDSWEEMIAAQEDYAPPKKKKGRSGRRTS